EAPVRQDENPDRSAPRRRSVRIEEEAGHEVLVVAERTPVVAERNEHDLVAGALIAVPAAAERDEGAVAILRRERVAAVEREPERGGVRLEQHVGRRRPRD